MSRKQSSGWGGSEPAEQHYLVEPRHLAGGGDLRHVTEYLRASGWKDKSRTGGPLVFDSPDGIIRVGYNPFVQPGGWTIRGKQTATRPGWHAVLSPQTPVEIVAGFTDALTRPRSAHAPHVWAPLEQNHWQTQRGQHVTAMSPDGNCFVRFHQSGPAQAHWWAGARDEHGRTWDATFTSTTPMHLVQAFTTALADPLPVMRPRGNVPPTRQVRTTSVSVRPSELAAWQQARITAARAATWARNSTRRTRPRTTARPHTTAGSARTRR
ncbi:DUF317 domain-containing protein [Streptomyces sp. SCSIO 30461]|uniref:DUF317 domain-containing protein n=1 Tax=Streptomyces sp. SCSIO 30461 TaxID=3118085 RepID=UPI0030D5C37A